jgi:D-alanine-D-alanine ligase
MSSMARRTSTTPPRKKLAAILHQAVAPDAPLDEQDVLQEAVGVAGALARLGFEVAPVPLTLDLGRAARILKKLKPCFVFNLTESVNGSGQLIHLAPSLLEQLGLPYTGATLESMFLTSQKVLAKRLMDQSGLPTPGWGTAEEALAGSAPLVFPCIVKNVWEHASIGVQAEGVVNDPTRLREVILERWAGGERHLYVENYIDGREFNLALLGGAPGPEVLSPSEILFVDYPAEKLRIVDYNAKWVEDSFEYNNTPRTFDFPPADEALLGNLKKLALDCWHAFGLRGYARVDFRVDKEGRPWIMEANANPCINPEASGYVATAERSGLDYAGLVRRIILDTDPGLIELG